MRTRLKFVKEAASFTLKNIKRVEVKFNPFHPNAVSVREFLAAVTTKRVLKTNPEFTYRAQTVSDDSDPLVTIQFKDNHKLVLNSKYLESNHIVKLSKQFEALHKDESEDL